MTLVVPFKDVLVRQEPEERDGLVENDLQRFERKEESVGRDEGIRRGKKGWDTNVDFLLGFLQRKGEKSTGQVECESARGEEREERDATNPFQTLLQVLIDEQRDIFCRLRIGVDEGFEGLQSIQPKYEKEMTRISSSSLLKEEKKEGGKTRFGTTRLELTSLIAV